MQLDIVAYLSLLRELTQTLAQLTEIEQIKIRAVREDDLAALNDCMKQEQVLSLSLRGYEQKRQTALVGSSFETLPLRALSDALPEEHRLVAKQVSEDLFRQYEVFRGSFEVAQNTLECNLHQVEKQLSSLGLDQSTNFGYREAGPELPSNLRTDFRA